MKKQACKLRAKNGVLAFSADDVSLFILLPNTGRVQRPHVLDHSVADVVSDGITRRVIR